MVEISFSANGIEGQIEIRDAYVEIWKDVAEHEDYDGPEEFEEWAANLILQNSGQLETMIEDSIHSLNRQVKEAR